MKHIMSINELANSSEIEKELEFHFYEHFDTIIKHISVIKSPSSGYRAVFYLDIPLPQYLTVTRGPQTNQKIAEWLANQINALIANIFLTEMNKFCRKYNFELLDIEPSTSMGNSNMYVIIKPLN